MHRYSAFPWAWVNVLASLSAQLSVQNQDLIEKNLTLQEHLRQAQSGSPSSSDTAQLAFELHQELARCLQDRSGHLLAPLGVTPGGGEGAHLSAE